RPPAFQRPALSSAAQFPRTWLSAALPASAAARAKASAAVCTSPRGEPRAWMQFRRQTSLAMPHQRATTISLARTRSASDTKRSRCGSLPPSKPRTSPALPRRSVCSPGDDASITPQPALVQEKLTMWFPSLLRPKKRDSVRCPKTHRRDVRAKRTFVPRLESREARTVRSPLTVLNNLDQGPDSLRDAIGHAKDGDTIIFAPSLAGQTITLTDQLEIKNSLDIEGDRRD